MQNSGTFAQTLRDQSAHVFDTDTLWRQTSMFYDAHGNQTKQIMGITPETPLGFTTVYTYDVAYPGKHWLEAQRGPDGVVTTYSYDLLGQRTEQVVGAGTSLAQTTRYEYDAIGRLVATTAGYGSALQRTDRTEYNADNTVARTIQNEQNGVYNPAVPDEDIVTSYQYDLQGRQVAVTNVLGRTDATRYDADGRVTWTARNLQPAQFDGQGQPVLQSFSPATPDANVATFYGYDGLGRTTLVTETGFLAGSFNTSTLRFSDSTERVTRTEYDELSRPVTVTLNYNPELPIDLLPDVNVRTITRYNKLGNPIWQRDGFGRWTKTDYDFLRRPYKIIQNYENGNATTVDAANASWTDGNDTDLITYLSYTADGQVRYRVENVDDVFGYASTNAFSSTLPITDRVTLYDYDSLGRVITTTVNYASFSTTAAELNRRQVNAYDAAGRLYATRDALGRWASTQYDALGRASGSIQNCRTGGNAAVATGCAAYSASTPDRNVRTEAHYDLLGRVQEVVDPLGVVARTEYDDLGRPVSQIQNYVSGQSSTASRNVTSQTSYNGLGWVTQTTDPAGASASYSHDVLGRVISANDPRSRQSQMGYDSDGTRRWLRIHDGRVTVMRTDGLGRVTATINNYQDGLADSNDGTARDLITITGYGRGGRTIQTIDAGGRMTLFGYDLMDRLTSVTENATGGSCAQAPCNVVTRYRYDRAGNRIAITDPNNHVRTFAYDAADQQVQAKDGLGQTTTFQYNAAGLLVFQSDPRGASNTRTFSYDNLDRQTGVSATNLGAIAMSYDGRGQRTGLTDPTGSTSFSYDPLGRVTEVAAPSTGSVGYGYSARGERTQITYPDSSVVDYEYWEDGQLKSVLQGSTALASYTYDTAGRLGSVTRANGTVTSYGYDAADRLTEQATTLSGSNVARFNASYNRRGERTAVTEVFGSASASDTALLKDINSAGGSAISAIVTMGSASYFVANDGVSGAELWRTDGTAAGTTLVKDINSGSDGSSPASLTVVGSLLFFTAYEPSSGSELWVSDGTSAGTTLVKDIRTGSTSTVLLHLTASGNRLFFNADDGTNGQELWVSDGTSAGTTLVKDIRTGSSGAAPESLLAWSGGVLFAANDGTNGRELWVSDGTSAGTTLIKDIRAGSSGSTISGGALAGSLAVFTANDGTNGLELWVSDGTAAGTTLVKDIESGASGSAPSNLRAMGGRVFFSALTSAAGRELWVTDGTAAGTALVKDIWPGSTSSNPTTLTALGGRLLFGATTSAEGGELWVSDGTATGTALVKDISPGSLGSSITGPTVVGGRVFFSASDGSSGIELWASDGTAAGTALVKDIVSGSGSSTPANLTALGERTLFRATDGVSGVELWSAAPGAQTTRSTSYGYDGLGRLTEALELAATSTTYRYTYDLAGNRTGAQTNGSTTSFSYNAANQVIGWSYDAAGNLLNDGTTTYAYDALSRVKQRGSTTYALNGDGVLVAETTGGTTTRYTQDLVAPLSQVLHDGSANYVYGAERLRAMGGAWYLGDMLGSVRATVDNSGATTGLAHYDPWGAPRDSGVAPFGFTGELQHNSTGLVYLRARWYNPYNAAFTGRDPFAGFQEQPYSLHPYQYAYSQPMLITDPSGRCILPIEQPFCSKEKPSPADRLIRDLFKFLNHATTHKIKYLRDLNHNLPCVTITSALAYKTWIDFVKTGGELDVKADYRREYGSTLSLFPDDKKGWTYQMSGNMLYGFIGMFAGFTDVELLDGAGAAQYQDHCREQFNPDAIGPGAPNCQITTYLPRTWDQRSDQAAVKAGIALFNKYYNLFSTPFSQDTEKKRKALKEVLTEFRDLIPEQEK